MAASNCMQAASISALSPSFPRNFSYPGICCSHFLNARSHSASVLNSAVKSHVSAVFTFVRGGSFLMVGMGGGCNVAGTGWKPVVRRGRCALPVALVSNQWSRRTRRCRDVIGPISTSASGGCLSRIGFVLHEVVHWRIVILNFLIALSFRHRLFDLVCDKRARSQRGREARHLVVALPQLPQIVQVPMHRPLQPLLD